MYDKNNNYLATELCITKYLLEKCTTTTKAMYHVVIYTP